MNEIDPQKRFFSGKSRIF